MYDAVYLISSRGRVLLSRSYGTREVPASHVAALAQSLFVRLYIQSAPPVVCIGDGRDKTTFIYVSAGAEDTVLDSEYAAASNVGLDATLRCTDAALRHRGVGGLVAAVACRRNPNAALAVVMLRRLLQLLQACASRAAPSTSLGALCLRKTAAGGGPLLSEAFILQSSDLVYEILDEAIDRGVPQTSDPKVLLLFAEAAANLRSTGGASAAAANSSEGGVKLAAQATGVAAWRRQGIRYRRNQLSIEVIEKLHILIAQNGTVLRQEAEGKVLLRSFLSGMPECKLITNEVLPQSDRQHLADDTQIQAITNAPLKGAAAQAAKTHTPAGPPSPAAAPAAASSSAASTSAPAAAPAAAPGAPGSSVVAQRVITEGAEGPLPVGAKERVKLSGCRYHPCVRVAQHTAERMILFTPPDGECELMSYRQVANNIPFLLSAAASAAAASAGASAAADLLLLLLYLYLFFCAALELNYSFCWLCLVLGDRT